MKKATFLIVSIILSDFLYAGIYQINKNEKTQTDFIIQKISQEDSVHIINRRSKFGIVPGQLIGNVKINDSMENVIKFLGNPDDGDSAMGRATAFWYTNNDINNNRLGIYAITDPNIINSKPIVKVISVTSPSFITEKRIHVGLSYKKISKIYKLKKKNSNIYTSNDGISFEFDKRKVCNAILVHDKNFDINTIYLNL